MLNILARSFLTATRVDTPGATEVVKPKTIAKPRWAAPGHWQQRPKLTSDEKRRFPPQWG